MDRDAILAALLEIEGLLLDERLNDDNRHASARGSAGASARAGRGDRTTGLARRSIAWVTAPARLDRYWSADHSTPRRPRTVGS
jgi:hypothetical protein